MDKRSKHKVEKKNKIQSVLDLENRIPKIKSNISYKLVFLGIVNLILVSSLVYTLFKVDNLSTDVDLKTQEENTISELEKDVLKSQLASNNAKIRKIEEYIASDTEIVDYVQLLDDLRNSGVISDYKFSSNEKIKDKTTNSGYLLKVTITGDEQSIVNSVNNLNNLPYLTRGVNFQMKRSEEGNYTAVYELIIYTDE